MGTDFLYGGAGNDRFIFSGVSFANPPPSDGMIDGGAGFDVIDVSNLTPTNLYSDRLILGNQRFQLVGIERILLGNNNQLIDVKNAPYEIVSGSGADTINVTGSGKVDAGAGDDKVFISPPFDPNAAATSGIINGGAGIDTLSTNILADVDLLAGTARTGNSSYTISGFENVTVTGFDTDTAVRGDNAANVLSASGTDYAGIFFDGRGGNDTLIGSRFADTILGGEGNDTITGKGGGDTIDGGGGFDVVTYTSLARTYSAATGTFHASLSVNSVTDTIANVERIDFRDATLTFDPDSNAAFVMRLYDSVLNREPDAFGLDSWLDTMAAGMSKAGVAQRFIASPEFAAKTGQLSNADFVEFLYMSSLGRPSDPGGKQGWVNALDQGMSRADVVIGFSESAEHRGLTADVLGRGLWITDENFQQVTALYDTFANRLPDQQGLLDWTTGIKNGMSLNAVAAGFAASPEFAQRTAGMSNEALVDFMYMNTLDRAADPAGRQDWVNGLNNGLSRGDLLLGFSASAEHFMLMQQHLYSGVSFTG